MNASNPIKDKPAKNPWFMVLLIYLGISAFLVSPFLFFNQTLYLADNSLYIEPAMGFIKKHMLQDGSIPLWNPMVLNGAPWVQVLWPVWYLPALFFRWYPFGLATGYFLMFHMVFAGAGGYWWQLQKIRSTRNETDAGAAFFFGLIFMCSGYMLGSTINIGFMATATWIPFNLLLLDCLVKTPRLWCLAGLSYFIAAQISAGRPQLIAFSLILYSFYLLRGLLMSLITDKNLKKLFLSVFMFAASVALAISISAINIFPLLEMVYEAPNIRNPFALHSLHWSTGWYDFLTMILMQPFGPTTAQIYPTYPNSGQFITSLFIGAPALTLAILGYGVKNWSNRWFWLAVTFLATIASAGQFTSIVPFFFLFSPDLSLFRFPIKLTIFILLPLAIAAINGWRSILRNEVKTSTLAACIIIWLSIGLAGMLVSVVPADTWKSILTNMGIYYAQFLSPEQLASTRQMPLELLIAAVSAIVPLALSLPAVQKRVPAFLPAYSWVTVTALLLIVNGVFQLRCTVDSGFFESKSGIAALLRTRYGFDPSTHRILTAYKGFQMFAPPSGTSNRSQMQLTAYGRDIMLSNANMDEDVRLMNGMSVIPNWSMFYYISGPLYRSNLSPAPVPASQKSDLPLLRWCQASNVQFFLTFMNILDPLSGKFVSTGRLDENLFPLAEDIQEMNLRIYRVSQPCPRLSLQTRFRITKGRYDTFRIMQNPESSGYDPLSEVLVSARSSIAKDELNARIKSLKMVSYPSESDGRVEIIEETPDRIKIITETSVPAFLVLRDSFYLGWIARDNGRPTRIYQADGAFRTVLIEAGKHEIYFAFEPASIKVGKAVAITSFIVMLVLLATGLIPQKKD